MKITYPHVIENPIGEKLIFLGVQKDPDGDRVVVENYVTPGQGPVMHTHLLQDESLTVLEGKLAYEVQGQPVQYAGAGDTVLFKRGTPHRFWNDGQETLHCKGWIKPANTIAFYLTAIYDAQNKSGTAQPERFDGAYLMTRYASEYDLPLDTWFCKKGYNPRDLLYWKSIGQV